MPQRSKFCIYRLYRSNDKKALKKLQEERDKYHLPKSYLLPDSAYDYFAFLRHIIETCEWSYALVCHDDVVLPLDIQVRVEDCIKKCDKEFGKDRWGVAGNAGVEVISDHFVRYVRDPHCEVIPSPSSKPHIVTCLDGNTLLLNIEALTEKEVSLPGDLAGFHLYDFVLSVETYKSGLICAVDSTLYAMHTSKGNQKSFNKAVKKKAFQDYCRQNFINKSFVTMNGLITIANNLDYLKRNSDDKRRDYHELVKSLLFQIYSKKEKKDLYIVIRTHLRRLNSLRRVLDSIRISYLTNSRLINIKTLFSFNMVSESKGREVVSSLQKEYEDLDIETVFAKGPYKKHYPRVAAIKSALEHIIASSPKSYLWFVDDDDFVFPEDIRYLPILVDQNHIVVGDSVFFTEEWNRQLDSSIPIKSYMKYRKEGYEYYKALLGENFVPFCSLIYPTHILRKIFSTYDLRGDFYEDYALFLLALKELEIRYYPLLLAGVSNHQSNGEVANDRTHWNYSYVTFISELVNKGYQTSAVYHYVQNAENIIHINLSLIKKLQKRIRRLEETKAVFDGFKNGLIWKTLKKYRKVKYPIKRFFKHLTGRRKEALVK